MPSAIVVLFVLYDRLRTTFSSLSNREVAPWLLTLLLFPLFAVGGYAPLGVALIAAIPFIGYARINRSAALGQL